MLPHEAEQRRIVMLPSLNRWLSTPATKQSVVEYYAKARAHLGRFVKGAIIDNEDYMKELARREKGRWRGRGFWEFRISFEPKARVFGVFAGPDLFFATHPRDRDDLKWDKRKWEHALSRVEREWDTLFAGMRWWIGPSFSHYVTFNGDDRHVGTR
jgi:hypothetical protein